MIPNLKLQYVWIHVETLPENVLICFSCFFVQTSSFVKFLLGLPQTKKQPAKMPSQKEIIFKPLLFRCYFSLRETSPVTKSPNNQAMRSLGFLFFSWTNSYSCLVDKKPPTTAWKFVGTFLFPCILCLSFAIIQAYHLNVGKYTKYQTHGWCRHKECIKYVILLVPGICKTWSKKPK